MSCWTTKWVRGSTKPLGSRKASAWSSTSNALKGCDGRDYSSCAAKACDPVARNPQLQLLGTCTLTQTVFCERQGSAELTSWDPSHEIDHRGSDPHRRGAPVVAAVACFGNQRCMPRSR